MAKKQIDLGLTGLDELFMDDKERAESKLPKIYEIPLSEIDEFPNHPFHVRLDEDMDQLGESIKERGIITPVTLRQKPDGRYEIVSGHRRAKACELAGLTTVKAEIKELSRDEAIILIRAHEKTTLEFVNNYSGRRMMSSPLRSWALTGFLWMKPTCSRISPRLQKCAMWPVSPRRKHRSPATFI